MPKKGVTLAHDYKFPESRYTRYDGPLEVAPENEGNALSELLAIPDEVTADRVE